MLLVERKCPICGLVLAELHELSRTALAGALADAGHLRRCSQYRYRESLLCGVCERRIWASIPDALQGDDRRAPAEAGAAFTDRMIDALLR